MKLLAVAGLAVAGAVIGVTLASVPASAQYYPYRPHYAPPPPPYYGGGYYAPRPGYRPYRRNPCPPYWTVQGGVCKPYRGY
ncbi:MAG: hypothetical protein ABW198_07410 [Pseudorhodoplanes sp.]